MGPFVRSRKEAPLGRFYQRPVFIAGLTALLLSVPATALAQPVSSSPTATRAAHARFWQRIHQIRDLTEPAWVAGKTARKATAPRLATSYQGLLAGVSTVPSSSRAWAVGSVCASACGTASEVDDTLILHFDGSNWTQSPSPSPGASFSELTGVKALSDSNVWAVGDYCASGCNTSAEVDDTLILHYNGTAWAQVASKNPSGLANALLAVTASSASDVWAVGLKCSSGCANLLTLTEHWNGSSWSNVSSPSPSSQGNILTGVASFPTHKAWTVGAAGTHTLVMRWTGSKWSRVTSPNPSSVVNQLNAVSASSASNAAAVGLYCASCSSTSGALHSLALRWNGTSWSKVSSPNLSSAFSELSAVAARTGSDAWAVGDGCASACNTNAEVDNPLIIHWNGSKWSKKTAAGGGAGFTGLFGVAASSSSNAWAVGVTCSSGCGTASEVDTTLIEHWNGTSWSVS